MHYLFQVSYYVVKELIPILQFLGLYSLLVVIKGNMVENSILTNNIIVRFVLHFIGCTKEISKLNSLLVAGT